MAKQIDKWTLRLLIFSIKVTSGTGQSQFYFAKELYLEKIPGFTYKSEVLLPLKLLTFNYFNC